MRWHIEGVEDEEILSILEYKSSRFHRLNRTHGPMVLVILSDGTPLWVFASEVIVG